MFRRIALTGTVAAIVSVAIAGVSLATASGGSGERPTFRLIEVRTQVVPVDLPPSGGSTGDEFILGGNLRNAADMGKVGTSNDVCITLSPNGAPLQCSGVITLKSGTINIAGNASGGPNFKLAITGGTGAYDEARGQLVASPTSNGNELIALDIDR
jgi:hypothetical protein